MLLVDFYVCIYEPRYEIVNLYVGTPALPTPPAAVTQVKQRYVYGEVSQPSSPSNLTSNLIASSLNARKLYK